MTRSKRLTPFCPRDLGGELTHELAEGLRTVTVLPLRVIFAIQEPDCIVDVATLRRAFLPAP
jgi:hypothetical protein